MELLKHELKNLDKNSIIISLSTRDELKNYFPQDQIVKYLTQLEYYNIDISKESKNYLISNLNKIIMLELNNDINSNIKYKTIDELLNFIKESNDYKNFISYLNHKIERAFLLSKFIGECNNVHNFYQALTLEELNQLNQINQLNF
jgi:hypothetical protein